NLVYVDTSDGIKRRSLEEPVFATRGVAGADLNNDLLDTHVWLSPRLVRMQSEKIRDTLVRIDPAGKSIYEKGFAGFMAEIEELDKYIQTVLAGVKQRTILVYHPAFGYFTDEYGLTQLSVEIEGKEPSARWISRIVESAREKNIHTLFVEPQFPRREVSMLAESISAKIVEIDPLAKDWAQNLMTFAQEIRDGLAP
ncbi:MAG: hypothetical protein EHM28_05475, partial [Spirochaetaceae bacterium]